MDTLLHFNLAHGSSPGRRAAGKTACQGFKLITPFVAIASILAAARKLNLDRAVRNALITLIYGAITPDQDTGML
jgi:hypothetical protein